MLIAEFYLLPQVPSLVSWLAPRAFMWCSLGSCSLERGDFSQPEALLSKEGSALQKARQAAWEWRSMRSKVDVLGVAHQVPCHGPQHHGCVPPAGSLCPLPLSQGCSPHVGMPAVIDGSCCPVSSAGCHLTCAPGNIPSSSGLGFWGSGSPPR